MIIFYVGFLDGTQINGIGGVGFNIVVIEGKCWSFGGFFSFQRNIGWGCP